MPPPDPAPLRLLLVEDNDYLRDTFAILLEAEGREVVVCGTAEEGLALDREAPFDLVLTDVGLPGLSGLELARAILAGRPEAWIVLLSGYALDDVAEGLGPHVRTLAKPFELSAVEAVLQEMPPR